MGDKLHVSWMQFVCDMDSLAKHIKEGEEGSRVFDIILAPACGGWIPARVLKSLLQVKECISVTEPGKIPFSAIAEKKVLIVDDISDSGQTFYELLEALRPYADSVKTAAIYYRPNSRVIPNYTLYDTDFWVVFPWEEGEDAIRDRDRKD